jgi:hypothetical protein
MEFSLVFLFQDAVVLPAIAGPMGGAHDSRRGVLITLTAIRHETARERERERETALCDVYFLNNVEFTSSLHILDM